jgi:hypothetical protein
VWGQLPAEPACVGTGASRACPVRSRRAPPSRARRRAEPSLWVASASALRHSNPPLVRPWKSGPSRAASRRTRDSRASSPVVAFRCGYLQVRGCPAFGWRALQRCVIPIRRSRDRGRAALPGPRRVAQKIRGLPAPVVAFRCGYLQVRGCPAFGWRALQRCAIPIRRSRDRGRAALPGPRRVAQKIRGLPASVVAFRCGYLQVRGCPAFGWRSASSAAIKPCPLLRALAPEVHSRPGSASLPIRRPC